MSAADRVRVAARGLGEVLITLGVVLLLFTVYELFWTNVQADRAQHQATQQLRREWQAPGPDPVAAPKPVTLPDGDALALLYIPRLGHGWVRPIVEGVTLPDLHKGIGHYPETQLPGQVGNFAVAGHRATNGEPFRDLDKLRVGDPVVVETKTTFYTYTVVKGPEIVAPTAVQVLLPVPEKPSATPTEKLMTLTTCNPRWASYQRMIFYARLTAESPTSAGMPAVLSGS